MRPSGVSTKTTAGCAYCSVRGPRRSGSRGGRRARRTLGLVAGEEGPGRPRSPARPTSRARLCSGSRGVGGPSRGSKLTVTTRKSWPGSQPSWQALGDAVDGPGRRASGSGSRPAPAPPDARRRAARSSETVRPRWSVSSTSLGTRCPSRSSRSTASTAGGGGAASAGLGHPSRDDQQHRDQTAREQAPQLRRDAIHGWCSPATTRSIARRWACGRSGPGGRPSPGLERARAASRACWPRPRAVLGEEAGLMTVRPLARARSDAWSSRG